MSAIHDGLREARRVLNESRGRWELDEGLDQALKAEEFRNEFAARGMELARKEARRILRRVADEPSVANGGSQLFDALPGEPMASTISLHGADEGKYEYKGALYATAKEMREYGAIKWEKVAESVRKAEDLDDKIAFCDQWWGSEDETVEDALKRAVAARAAC